MNCDVFIFLDSVQYSKNSFINRNKIKTPTGDMWLTLSVDTKGKYGQKISETKISNTSSNDTHWKSICSNYSRTPYFNSYKNNFESIYNQHWDYLADLNEELIRTCCQILGIANVKFIKTSDLSVSGNGSELLINICKETGADSYLSGFGGAKYQEESLFKDSGIDLTYYNFKHPLYRQLWGDFIPNLSIIDLLLNEGENSRKILESAHQ